MDMMPEGLVGMVGFADDLVLAALVLRRMLARLPAGTVAESWRGDRDLSELVDEVVALGPAMVGDVIWQRLSEWVEGS
jgi:uncharacterized membrane protein YkvA (DUF1232 family)